MQGRGNRGSRGSSDPAEIYLGVKHGILTPRFLERNVFWYTPTRCYWGYVIFILNSETRSRTVFLLSFVTDLSTPRNVAGLMKLMKLWWQQFLLIFLRITNVQILVWDPIPHRAAAPYEELFFLGHSPPLPYVSRRLCVPDRRRTGRACNNWTVVCWRGLRHKYNVFESQVAPLFHWVATVGKLFTHTASPVSQLQEIGVQKGVFGA